MEMKLKHTCIGAFCAIAVHQAISAKEVNQPISAKKVTQYQSQVVLTGEQVTDDYLFGIFLNMISDENMTLLSATILGFNIESPQELREFEKFRNKIRKVKDRFDRATNRAWYREHCLGGRSAMTKTRKEIFQEMDNVDLERTAITKSYLESTMKSLNKDEKSRVLSYFDKTRDGTSVTKINAEEFHAKSPSWLIKSNTETDCVQQSGEYYSSEGESHEE